MSDRFTRKASAVTAPPAPAVEATVMASDVRQTGHMAFSPR
ncbi:MAG TPA: hypothetical protein VIF09_19065 [Polyangiaceae bacterium]